MNKEYDSTDLGNISVDNEVIKNIALKAATEIGGIYEIRKRRLAKMWNTLIKKNPACGVKLEFTDASELNITLKLLIEYGAKIPYAAEAAQENVKKAVEHMTGLTVAEVAVKIVGVHSEKDLFPKGNKDSESVDESLSV